MALSDKVALDPVLLQELDADERALLLEQLLLGIRGVEVDAVVALKLLDVDPVLLADFLVLGEGDPELEELLGDVDLLLREQTTGIVLAELVPGLHDHLLWNAEPELFRQPLIQNLAFDPLVDLIQLQQLKLVQFSDSLVVHKEFEDPGQLRIHPIRSFLGLGDLPVVIHKGPNYRN